MPALRQADRLEIDRYVEAYERGSASSAEVDVASYLPSLEHPLYLSVLQELVRVELEIGWRLGRPKPLEHYRQRFPELFADEVRAAELEFEENRQQDEAASKPHGGERIETTHRRSNASPVQVDGFELNGVSTEPPVELGPEAAHQLLESSTPLPPSGARFLEFHLQKELGRGAFGRVFLAQQGELADRPVVLKLAADLGEESRSLAQLQHTNIVPIHSIHRLGRVQAICMPYLGSTTLADAVRGLDERKAPPTSGLYILSTLVNSVGLTKPEGTREAKAVPPAAATGRSSVPRQVLERLSYVDAVLWLGARLADGLAHAHERGILHRDLKPANILLTDEGQPMLLDFSLAQDTKLRETPGAALVGGTLPYMAPEQMHALLHRSGKIDAQADIYALAVILYQLLCRRLPYAVQWTDGIDSLPRLLESRMKPAPALRPLNPAVTPAVEAIIRRCLDPDPARRYPSARAQAEDLDRQLAHLPLRHTREPSLRERTRKWLRRHPRLTSAAGVASLATSILVGVFILLLILNAQLGNLKARTELERFESRALTARIQLQAPPSRPTDLAEGLKAARTTLEPYGVLDDAHWQDRPVVRRLDAASQERLRNEARELLFLAARAAYEEGRSPESLSRALELNRLAQGLAVEPADLYVLQRQQDVLLGRLEAKQAITEAENASPRSLAALAFLNWTQGEHAEALRLARSASRLDPQNPHVWSLLADIHFEQARFGDAAACLQVYIALRPGAADGYDRRGVACLENRDYSEATTDLDEALRLEPDRTQARINRALVRLGTRDLPGAEADLTLALNASDVDPRAYFIRARVRSLAGNDAGVRADHAEGLKRPPQTEAGWIARGLAQLHTSPEKALADMEGALRLNPRSRQALENKAHILSDRLNRTAEAIQSLDEALKHYPDYVLARSGRAVLRARLGQRDAAVQDARDALLRDTRPLILYQLAGAYAQTSRQHPEDVQEALRLLSQALRQGFGLDLLEQDHDLDPIRDNGEFRRVVEAARALQQAGRTSRN
jgi:serine/threonine protein kinase/tetratricopeptide (TPR) repeat protein